MFSEEFNKLTNTLKRAEQQSTDPYPWLEEDDERGNLMDSDIFEKYIDLETLSLTQKEKEELMDILCRNNKALSLGDEVGACPNIKVEIDVVDRTPFSIRPYYVKKEDKQILDMKKKRLGHLSILKDGFQHIPIQ